MLVNKEVVCDYLHKQNMSIVGDREKCMQLCIYCYTTYNIPKTLTSDYIYGRVPFEEATEFILYALVDGFNQIIRRRKNLNEFFTETEIRTYSKARFAEEKIDFPIKIPAIQVAPDQWIGRISVKEIIKLRKAQLINYNENAQRSLTKIIKGEKEYYKISINKAAVKSIQQMLSDGTFIPNTLTLNIPEETEYNFTYDESARTLIIKDLQHFDITDGYHRFIALSNLWDLNPEFDYTMELRIVNFNEEKAKFFIFQEDQKTKMSRTESNKYNVYAPGNKVCDRLNTSSRCNLQGLIGTKGIISDAELSSLIDYFYFKKGIPKEKEQAMVISVTKELTDNFNMLTEYDLKYLQDIYSFKQILGVMYVFDWYRGKDKTDMCETIERVIAGLEENKSSKFYNRNPRKVLMNEVEKIMEGVK